MFNSAIARFTASLAIAVMGSLGIIGTAAAGASLAASIDRLVAEKAGERTSPPPADDAEFLRRAWLDFDGGIVEPLDLQHTANPPSHPELLDLLAKELIAKKFDLRWLIGELAKTAAYARSSRLPEAADRPAERLCLTAIERRLTCEQQLRSFLIASSELDRVTANEKPDPSSDENRFSLADFTKAFAAALANPAKEPELAANPSLRSSLFFRNSDHVQWALKPRPGNLADRLSKLSDADAIAEELYLAILTRLPDAEEKQTVAEWLNRNIGIQSAAAVSNTGFQPVSPAGVSPANPKTQAISDLAWAMLSSAEWFANH